MDWRPGTSHETLRQRARLKHLLRETLDARDWLEIDAPVLIDSPDFEPNITLFRATLPDGTPAGSLHSSPELTMKRLLAAYPDLPGAYYLGPVFRASEAGRRHNPEFTMLEWYDNGATLDGAIATTLELIQSARRAVGMAEAPVERQDYGTLFRRHLDLDPYHADRASLALRLPDAPFVQDLHGVLDPLVLSREDIQHQRYVPFPHHPEKMRHVAPQEGEIVHLPRHDGGVRGELRGDTQKVTVGSFLQVVGPDVLTAVEV